MATTPPRSPPLPAPPIAQTPGPRATKFQRLFADALSHTLRICSYAKFAACFPTPAAHAAATLDSVWRQITDKVAASAHKEFEDILAEREVVAGLNELERLGFVFHGGFIAEGAVEPPPVVEDFDVVEEGRARLGAGVKEALAEEFGLQRGPKALHVGVVVAVRPPAHARNGPVGMEEGTVGVAGVLAAAVGVVQEAGSRLAPGGGLGEGARDQGRGHDLVGGPAHHLATVKVEDPGQVEPALGGGDAGEVGRPDLVGARGCGSLRQAVGGDGTEMARVGGPGPEAPLLAGAQPPAAHDPGHAVAAAALPASSQGGGEPRAAAGAPAGRKAGGNLHPEPGVLLGTRPPPATAPGVEARAAHAQGAAERAHRVLARELLDPGHLQRGGAEKMASAFFRISRCWRSSSFSRRRARFWRSSSAGARVRAAGGGEPGALPPALPRPNCRRQRDTLQGLTPRSRPTSSSLLPGWAARAATSRLNSSSKRRPLLRLPPPLPLLLLLRVGVAMCGDALLL
ncbi:MAG: hypothetical protein LQ342_006645 [Letrouitia transgressa]|nr:MAG: hypothetical protein LQ342_006645 [Letrouitia transgressa]